MILTVDWLDFTQPIYGSLDVINLFSLFLFLNSPEDAQQNCNKFIIVT